MSEKKTYTQQLQDHIWTHFEDNDSIDAQTLDAMIEEFVGMKKEEYEALKKDRKLSFGKYKGYTVKELSASEKGSQYLAWLLQQGWFTEKNPILVEEIKALGIKKVKFKRTMLE